MAFMLGLYQTRAGVRVFKHRSGLINGEGSTCCVSWESWRHWQRRHHHASTMPPEALRKAAISHFRTHYAQTLLNFLPPQQLIEDDAGDELPLGLLLCIIVLTSRSLQYVGPEASSPRSLGDYYEEAARRELSDLDDEPSLVMIQCCLILCIYEIGEGAEHRGWLRLGHAAKLAQLLQLHKQDANFGIMDWGKSAESYSAVVNESKRRTFWCCFCLERLLANGRDRLVSFAAEDITTPLPQSDENFIYGRLVPTCKLSCSAPGSVEQCAHPRQAEPITTYTVRIVEILSNVITWNGRGGRHVDASNPWLPDMPFHKLNSCLRQWEESIPQHLKQIPQNTSAVIALGQGRLWAHMWMVYHQARAYLHREYLPFMPKIGYDPIQGPCDGPKLLIDDPIVAAEFWQSSTAAMIESANAISDLYQVMQARDLSATAYPTLGFGLLVAASIHVQLVIFGWESCQRFLMERSSLDYLKQDMEGINHMGQGWSLAVHWIRQISLYYKLNLLIKRSWTAHSPSIEPPPPMDIQSIKDGIMNYVRQIGPNDRDARDANLKPDFDFEGWLYALQSSARDGSTDASEQRNQDGRDNQPFADDGAGHLEATSMAYPDLFSCDKAFFDSLTEGFHALDGVAATSLPDWNFPPW
ncbi:fungal specific transcription factor domain-containing protein [Sarocladium implicatum]|nr:fungal specific transcription factor domain-containing protein [Sarocladium implicatum]